MEITPENMTSENIKQELYVVDEDEKFNLLNKLIYIKDPGSCIIFCRTKENVDIVYDKMKGMGYSCYALHGGMLQNDRLEIMQRFKRGEFVFLVATDVAARGIDIESITHIINYDIPVEDESYVHRIGRTARAGRTGRAFSFVVGMKEIYKLRDIQRYSKAKIVLNKVPTAEDVEEVRTNTYIDHIKEIIEEGRLTSYSSAIEKLIEEDYNTLDIAAALLRMAMGEKNKQEEAAPADFEDTGAEPGMVRLFINIGSNQKIRPGDVVGSIAGESGIPGKLIGSISIHDKFTFVEVPMEYAHEVLNSMKDNQIKGKRINIEPANSRR
jgi:ATP-dependent RNA helicase DeaD